MRFTREQLTAAFRATSDRDPTAQEMAMLVDASTRGGFSDRAREYVGTPYQWGGTTKQGIDCSAFISNVWGVGRQTTDTLTSVARPVSTDTLKPGDALNLPTWKDPRGYGHVRMFDGWADPDKKTMHVYESSVATGGVVRRVIPYDPSYQPMRLNTLAADDAEQRAETVAKSTAAAGVTAPSRPPDRVEQQFLEANAAPVPPPPSPPKASSLMDFIMGGAPDTSRIAPLAGLDTTVPGRSRGAGATGAIPETPNEKAAREFRENESFYKSFNDRFKAGFTEPLPLDLPTAPPLRLPTFGTPPPVPLPRRPFILGV